MTIQNPFIKSLTILERRLKHVTDRLGRICSMYEATKLSSQDNRTLQTMRKNTQRQISALQSIIIRAHSIIDTPQPLPGEPGSNPVADKYRHSSQSPPKREQEPG